MKLYNSYCYADIAAVSNSLSSNYFIGDGQVLESVSILNANQLLATYKRQAITYDYTITVPDCTREGFDNSFFGVTIQDSIDVTWIAAGALLAVWAIKNLRRGT